MRAGHVEGFLVCGSGLKNGSRRALLSKATNPQCAVEGNIL